MGINPQRQTTMTKAEIMYMLFRLKFLNVLIFCMLQKTNTLERKWLIIENDHKYC